MIGLPLFVDPTNTPWETLGEFNVRLFDVRAGAGARDNFKDGHFEGATFVDLEKELSDEFTKPQNGRHPLPRDDEFQQRLATWGVEHHTNVVVYDDQGGALAAARLAWMLRAAGRSNVSVMTGSIARAKDAGWMWTDAQTTDGQTTDGQTTDGQTTDKRASRNIVHNQAASPSNPSAYQSHEEIALSVAEYRHTGHHPMPLIDVRSARRYMGLEEPLDPVAGHIPGALNLPYTSFMDENLVVHPADLCQSIFLKLTKDGPITLYCGSGVTASYVAWVALHAGLTPPTVYTGSFSEWCRRHPTDIDRN